MLIERFLTKKNSKKECRKGATYSINYGSHFLNSNFRLALDGKERIQYSKNEKKVQ